MVWVIGHSERQPESRCVSHHRVDQHPFAQPETVSVARDVTRGGTVAPDARETNLADLWAEKGRRHALRGDHRSHHVVLRIPAAEEPDRIKWIDATQKLDATTTQKFAPGTTQRLEESIEKLQEARRNLQGATPKT